uniref:F-box-like/WD repeat-containing protein TBL1XR1 isoform X1 n=1 Tax=Rhizophora mucronata TaxID=61149 RepID=A0A2P2MRJ5_RHIMU
MSSVALFFTAPPLPNKDTNGSSTARHCPQEQNLAQLIDKSKSSGDLRQIHAFLHRHNLHDHPILNFKLQRSYSSLGYLHHSLALFNKTQNPSIYLYTSIIHAHAVLNLHYHAFFLYVQMLNQNIAPNAFTFSSILKSCPLRSAILIHAQAVKLGFDSQLYVRTCLIDVYARGGDVGSARKLFDTMPEKSLVSLTAMITCYAKYGMVQEARLLFNGLEERDVVCWNVMIDGYSQHGFPNESLGLFRQMLKSKLRPCAVTVVAVLSACGQIGALESGRWVHSYILNNGIEINVLVGTALIDMYCKCGSLEDARLVFEGINNKDVVAWNSMIVGHAMQGFSQDALQLFYDMCRIGYQPTDITFIGVLSACVHGGMVEEGRRHFCSMKDKYGIEPKVEHYGCMINLLCRSCHLEEAYELAKNMQIEQDPVIWGTLLGGCRVHGDISLGEEIADFLLSRNLANSGTFILLSNMYAAAGNWERAARVRSLMKDSGVEREHGCSSIEVNDEVHEFLAGDVRHPKTKEIFMILEICACHKGRGYTPETDAVFT